MKEIPIKKKITSKFLLKLFLMINIIKYCIVSQCNDDRDNPFYIDNSYCYSICSKEYINNNRCTIENDIIKTQWLNNIIYIGGRGCAFVNIVVTEKNNLYFLTTSYPKSNERIFYLLDNEGYGIKDKDNPKIIVEINDINIIGKFESEAFVVNLYESNDNNEYFISLAKAAQYFEIYDFNGETSLNYFDTVENVFPNPKLNKIFTTIGVHLKLKLASNEKKNTYLIGILACEYTDQGQELPHFYLYKTNFTSININAQLPLYNRILVRSSYSKMISCFETNNNFIMCFFQNPDFYYTIIVFDYELSEKTQLPIVIGNSNTGYEEMFFSCIHFFNETGVFGYFDNENIFTFEFKRYLNNNNAIINNYNTFNKIRLDNYNFNRNKITLCDMIKFKEKHFYFVGTLIDRNILLIASILNYNEEKFSIRIYTINTKNMYDYEFSEYIKIGIYKNFLAIGSSYYEPTDDWKAYSSLIIFSYPKAIENSLNLINYIYHHNDTKINELLIELDGKYTIDNNLFGLIYSGIEIIGNCIDSETIYLADLNNTKITSNYLLPQNETIKLIVPKAHIYEPFSCRFKYSVVVTEPEFSKFNIYPIKYNDTGTIYEGEDIETAFYENLKNNYAGKSNNFTLYTNETITDENCGNNCGLCYTEKNDKCISCEYSSYYDRDFNLICQDNPFEVEKTNNPTQIENNKENLEVEHSEENEEEKNESNKEKENEEKENEEKENEEKENEEKENEEIENEEKEKENEEIENEEIENEEKENEEKEIKNEEKENEEKEIENEEIENEEKEIENEEKEIEKEETVKNSDEVSETKIKNLLCTFDEIIKNECGGEINNGQIKQVYDHIKSNLINGNYTLIKTVNVIFEISAIEDQLKSENKDISNVDLGICESRLKQKYNISPSKDLIIFKIDVKNIEDSTTYVQYEIYEPDNYTLLKLDVCSDLNIHIYSPVYLNSETKILFSSLEKAGYNLFNSSDSFYNDFCTPYTTTNGTDILLEDRKKDIYSKNGNKILCQDGCELLNYNETTEKAKCNCKPQNSETILDKESIFSAFKVGRSQLEESFFNTLSNSNFQVLQCFKLVFDFKNFGENIGRIIMTIILLFVFVCLILYFIYGGRKLENYLALILKQKIFNNDKSNKKVKINNKSKLKLSNKSKSQSKKSVMNLKKRRTGSFHIKRNNQNQIIINQIDNNNSEKISLNNNNKINSFNNNKSINENIFDINKKNNEKINSKIRTKRKASRTVKLRPPLNQNQNKTPNKLNIMNSSVVPKKINKNIDNKKSSILGDKLSQNIIISKNVYIKMNKGRSKKHKKSTLFKSSKDGFISGNNKLLNQSESLNKLEKLDMIEKKNIHNNNKYYTSQELNTMSYKEALKYDKRTYFQYYWSLIIKKQIFLFIIFNDDDYNLITIKVVLFLISFSLYFTLNGFFFNDSTMHKLYQNNGSYELLNQLPIILYSTFITTVINMILKYLSLSEKNMLDLKRETNYKTAKKNSKQIWSFIKKKIIIFFILSILLMAFFWYFISCFCAVYKNTQIILITDSLLSFALSMLYPFGIYLIPGIIRIPALRAKSKDKECLYKASVFASMA